MEREVGVERRRELGCIRFPIVVDEAGVQRASCGMVMAMAMVRTRARALRLSFLLASERMNDT